MFDKIINHPELISIMCGVCSENNASVEFSDFLKLNKEIDDSKVLILRPDVYYNAKKIEKRPKSPDCLILINCEDKKHYDLYLIELKDVSDTRDLKYETSFKKLSTMINDFFVKFADIFDEINYGGIKFYLISTYPKGSENLSEEEYRKRIKGSALDVYASQKPLKLYNKAVLIEPRASLTIMPC